MEGCRVGLLGGFRVEVAGRRIPDEGWRHRRSADLVKILALAPAHRLPREQVMEMLWPELPLEAASANLRKATYFARKALGGEAAIGVRAGMVSLWPGGELLVDVEEFERSPSADSYGGELLPEDRYAEWTEPRRERTRQRFVDVLRRSGDWERVLEVDRADEEAHRAVMRTHLEAGNRTAAIRQFEQLRQVLRVDLGVGPGPETVALFERALEAGHEPPTPAQRAQALIARGLVHWNLRELDEADRIARQARAFAVEEGLGRELGEASTLLGLVALARGRWSEEFRADFLNILERAPDRARFVLNGHLCMAEGSLYGWQGESTAPLARDLLRAAQRTQNADGEAMMWLLLGACDLLAGRLEEAEMQLTRSLAMYREMGAGSGEAMALLHLADAKLARERRAEAADLVDVAWPLVTASDLEAHLRVRALAARVRSAAGLEAQLAVVDEAERTVVRSQVCGPCSIGLCVESAMVWARAGEFGKARKCLGEGERLAGLWQGGAWLAATWEARAHLRLAEGDPGQAAALRREAADLFAESGRPLDAARCRGGVPAAV